MLAILIKRAKEDNQVDGLILHLVDGGLSLCSHKLSNVYDFIL
jgi:hypothetical protein